MKIGEFIQECRRVLRVTRKPSRDEYQATLKVAGIGILVIGFIGFVLFMIKQLIGV